MYVKVNELVHHDENTLLKVYAALTKTMSEEQAIDAVSNMQNEGILFRERVA